MSERLERILWHGTTQIQCGDSLREVSVEVLYQDDSLIVVFGTVNAILGREITGRKCKHALGVRIDPHLKLLMHGARWTYGSINEPRPT